MEPQRGTSLEPTHCLGGCRPGPEGTALSFLEPGVGEDMAAVSVVEDGELVVDKTVEAECPVEGADARGFHHNVKAAGATMTWLRLADGR